MRRDAIHRGHRVEDDRRLDDHRRRTLVAGRASGHRRRRGRLARGRRRLGAQRRGIRLDQRIGVEPELFAQQGGVDARVLEGARPIAGGGHRGHELHGARRIQWKERGRLTPPAHDGRELAARLGVGREPLESADGEIAQPRALGGAPLLELGRAVDEEPVEKGSLVERHGTLELVAVERLLKFGDVAGDVRRFQAHARGRNVEQGVVTQCAARRVQTLRQRVPGAFGVDVRPQQPDELVAAEACVARRSEHAQQCQQPALGSRTRERLSIAVGHVHTAKRVQSKHFAQFPGSRLRTA